MLDELLTDPAVLSRVEVRHGLPVARAQPEASLSARQVRGSGPASELERFAEGEPAVWHYFVITHQLAARLRRDLENAPLGEDARDVLIQLLRRDGWANPDITRALLPDSLTHGDLAYSESRAKRLSAASSRILRLVERTDPLEAQRAVDGREAALFDLTRLLEGLANAAYLDGQSADLMAYLLGEFVAHDPSVDHIELMLLVTLRTGVLKADYSDAPKVFMRWWLDEVLRQIPEQETALSLRRAL